MTRPTPDERFWTKVEISDDPYACWRWTKELNSQGYGRFTMWSNGSKNGTRALAHRYAYEIIHGPIPTGLLLMHECDSPACVNPLHLRLGTQLDNVRDAMAKGRSNLSGLALNRTPEAVARARAAKAAKHQAAA